MGVVNEDLAKKVSGREQPKRFLVLDSSVLDMEETHKIIREDVKQNRIVYEFPAGLNKLDLFEECRALTLLDDFATMYDVTMQLLVDKDVTIKIRNNDGSLSVLEEMHITNKFQDLRGYSSIDKWPVLVTWLTEFMAAELLKKYPLPGSEAPQSTTAKKKTKGGERESTKQA